MKKYYEILGLKEGATKQEIKKAYNKLSKELDPKKNNNEEFFVEETKKLNEAYDKLMNTSILSSKKVSSKTSTKKENTEPNNANQNIDPNKSNKRSNKMEYTYLFLLVFIGTGIWGIFLQNMGLITTPDFTQEVRVVNTVDVEGSVEVDGGYVTTEVDGTVDVNLEAINGQYNVFYDRGGNEFYHRIPVYTFD